MTGLRAMLPSRYLQAHGLRWTQLERRIGVPGIFIVEDNFVLGTVR
jgi:hypothetical protein